MLMPCPLVCLSAQHTQHTRTQAHTPCLQHFCYYNSNVAPPPSPCLSLSHSLTLSAPPLWLHGVPCICNWLSLVATLRIYISTYQQQQQQQLPCCHCSWRGTGACSLLFTAKCSIAGVLKCCCCSNCSSCCCSLCCSPSNCCCRLLQTYEHTPNIYCFQSHLPIYSWSIYCCCATLGMLKWPLMGGTLIAARPAGGIRHCPQCQGQDATGCNCNLASSISHISSNPSLLLHRPLQPFTIGMAMFVSVCHWMWAILWTLWRSASIGIVAHVHVNHVPLDSFQKPIYTSKICRKSIPLSPNALKYCANGRRSGSVSMWWVCSSNL